MDIAGEAAGSGGRTLVPSISRGKPGSGLRLVMSLYVPYSKRLQQRLFDNSTTCEVESPYDAQNPLYRHANDVIGDQNSRLGFIGYIGSWVTFFDWIAIYSNLVLLYCF